MSIIYKALKKAVEEKDALDKSSENGVSEDFVRLARKIEKRQFRSINRFKKNKGKIFLYSFMAVVIFVNVLVAGSAWYLMHSNFRPPQLLETGSDYICAGIYFKGDRAFAIINGEIVHDGDIIAGARVNKIFYNRVNLIKNNESLWLEIK